MNLKRTVTILAVFAALAAWFSAAMTPTWRPPTSIREPSAPIDTRGAALAAEVSRLRQRLQPDTPPRNRVRNPFVFGARRPLERSRVSATSTVPIEPPTAPVPAVALTLSGLAEDQGPDGPVRTAIISGTGQLFLVHLGDTLTAGARTLKVAAISDASVDLVDVALGTSEHLALK